MKINIKYKLSLAISAMVIMAISIIGLLSYNMSKEALKTQAMSQLNAIHTAKSQQIEKYFSQIRNQISTFSESMTIKEAMVDFKKSFHQQSNKPITQEMETSLKSYYRNEYLSRLNANSISQKSLSQYWPADNSTLSLQYHYLSNNYNSTAEKHNLIKAKDGSAYSEVHEIYHPIIRSYLEKFGYYDIFLIDPETGHIVYSVFKEVDYGTSLTTGPYSRTNFAEIGRASCRERV